MSMENKYWASQPAPELTDHNDNLFNHLLTSLATSGGTTSISAAMDLTL